MLSAVATLSPPSAFGIPSYDYVRHYPDLAPLRQALLAGYWAGIEAYFDKLPAYQDPTIATAMVARTRGVEKFLQVAGGGPGTSVLAGTLLGTRLVVKAWNARGLARARQTSKSRFRSFHQLLRQAEQVLSDVTAADPGNIAAWTARLRTARGLQMGIAEATRRYEQAAKARPHPLDAQLSHLQQLCPKWGGSPEHMHRFARQCAESSPPGSLNAVAVAEAHLERAYHVGSFSYLRQRHVRESVLNAVARSVDHPEFRPVHGWVQAECSFSRVLWLAGERRAAAERLRVLGNRVTTYPWDSRLQLKAIQLISRPYQKA